MGLQGRLYRQNYFQLIESFLRKSCIFLKVKPVASDVMGKDSFICRWVLSANLLKLIRENNVLCKE
jgi:hypothetical protein